MVKVSVKVRSGTARFRVGVTARSVRRALRSRDPGTFNPHKIAGAPEMSLSELFAEVESAEPRDDT